GHSHGWPRLARWPARRGWFARELLSKLLCAGPGAWHPHHRVPLHQHRSLRLPDGKGRAYSGAGDERVPGEQHHGGKGAAGLLRQECLRELCESGEGDLSEARSTWSAWQEAPPPWAHFGFMS